MLDTTMKKETLETFIRRYTLANIIPKVKWKYSAKDKTLHTRAVADNRCFVADVVMNDFVDFGADDTVVCIGDTEKVRGMMSPFGEEIAIEINKNGDRVLGFTISYNDCQSYCTAADPTAIDPVPKNLQDVPEFHVVVPLTEEFLEKFLKATMALKDVDSFTIGMNKKGVFEIVLGYTTANSNRIRFTPQTAPDKNKLDVALTFPIKNLAAVFKANSDIPDGSLSINNCGIIRADFKNEKYACSYFQFANKKN
jgi:hypothetical protein